MKLKKSKNRLVIPLLLAVTILWGIIIFRAISYLNINDSNEENTGNTNEIISNNVAPKNILASDIALSYSKLKRDPFTIPKLREYNDEVVREKAIKKISTPEVKLEYKIKGVIINEKKQLVIFEDLTNGKTLFLRQGEKYLDIEIIEIQMSRVILTENNFNKRIIELK